MTNKIAQIKRPIKLSDNNLRMRKNSNIPPTIRKNTNCKKIPIYY